jgi:BTB/POZ domain-containing protein KCTD9
MQTSRMPERLSYQNSCSFMQREGWLGAGEIPPLPEKPPRYDDEILGVEFFRTCVENARLENLTIPRTYFSRSEIRNSSFAGSDLSESVANWNDFNDVNFSYTDLSRFDFRGCSLVQVRFQGADLRNADLRRCDFEHCDFMAADLTGTKLTREAGESLILSDQQRQGVDWQDEDGPDPDGG